MADNHPKRKREPSPPDEDTGHHPLPLAGLAADHIPIAVTHALAPEVAQHLDRAVRRLNVPAFDYDPYQDPFAPFRPEQNDNDDVDAGARHDATELLALRLFISTVQALAPDTQVRPHASSFLAEGVTIAAELEQGLSLSLAGSAASVSIAVRWLTQGVTTGAQRTFGVPPERVYELLRAATAVARHEILQRNIPINRDDLERASAELARHAAALRRIDELAQLTANTQRASLQQSDIAEHTRARVEEVYEMVTRVAGAANHADLPGRMAQLEADAADAAEQLRNIPTIANDEEGQRFLFNYIEDALRRHPGASPADTEALRQELGNVTREVARLAHATGLPTPGFEESVQGRLRDLRGFIERNRNRFTESRENSQRQQREELNQLRQFKKQPIRK